MSSHLDLVLSYGVQAKSVSLNSCHANMSGTPNSSLLELAISLILIWHFLVQQYHQTFSLAISRFMDTLYVPIYTVFL